MVALSGGDSRVRQATALPPRMEWVALQGNAAGDSHVMKGTRHRKSLAVLSVAWSAAFQVLGSSVQALSLSIFPQYQPARQFPDGVGPRIGVPSACGRSFGSALQVLTD